LLQMDGRMASSEIAKNTGVPEATVRYRLKRIIERKYIQIVAAANPIKLGFGIAACISIEAESRQVDHVIEELEKIDRVAYIAQMTSIPNVEIETYIETINELHEVLSRVEAIDGIIRVDTSFIRRIAKERFDFGTPMGLAKSDSPDPDNEG
jgi:Lrp/AsnC family transcriptional regulator for asnA, asnC and gidA